MSESSYRYTIEPNVPIEEVEITLLLSILGVEALYGESQARLDIGHAFSADRRSVVIAADTAVGRDLNKLFAGFLAKEFGAGSFTVERFERTARPQDAKSNPQPETVTA
jgi:hypothetical protein